MGFFGSDRSYSTSSIEDLLKDDSLNIHENLSLVEAAYEYAAENEMNWNAIMESVAMTEMDEMSNSGSDYSVVAEAGFFESVVNFFKKVWEKIKSLFKKFMVMLGSLVGKDKDFAKKHGDTIRKNIINIPSDAKIKGYVFTPDKLKTSVTAATTKLVDWVNAVGGAGQTSAMDGITDVNLVSDSYDVGDMNDKVRGILCTGMPGHSNAMTDSEMRQAAFEQGRNDKDSPDDIAIDNASVSYALAQLEKGDKAKSDAGKLYRDQEKQWKSLMKAADKFSTEKYKTTTFADNPNNDTKIAQDNKDKSDLLKKISNGLALCKTAASCIQTLCAVYLQCVKDEYSQYRKICVKVVTYKSTKEGASVTHYTESTHFAGLNLI